MRCSKSALIFANSYAISRRKRSALSLTFTGPVSGKYSCIGRSGSLAKAFCYKYIPASLTRSKRKEKMFEIQAAIGWNTPASRCEKAWPKLNSLLQRGVLDHVRYFEITLSNRIASRPKQTK
ncbi:hypothetical protein KC341_g16 [Hortaea werneckii]|nr:hypothetical protein KC341_g16 [Hortaea werneckii]